MKIKNILASLALALVAGAGVAAGLKEAPAREAKATPEKLATYNLVGTKTSWATNAEYMYYDDSRPGNAAQLLNYHFDAGDEFKIRTEANWTGTVLGYPDLVREESGGGFFVYGAENDNIMCALTGNYDIFVTTNNKIYISHAANNASTAKIYVQLQSWEHTYVYAFDETSIGNADNKTIKPFGDFPGTQISVHTDNINLIDQHSASLGGIGCIEVPYLSLANTKIIISNGYSGEGNQSANQDLVANTYYYHTGAIPSIDLGKVSDLVFDVYDVIKNGGSICSLDSTGAQALLAKYNDEEFYEVTCQDSFNKTTFYTWADAGKEGNADFTGAQVIAQLTALASGSQSSYSQVSFVYGSESSTIIIVIIAATIVACGVGIFLLKRKHN